MYQAYIQENGNYVFKYFGGIAILQLPFFLIGHEIALNSQYLADGFSPPYQNAIAFGNILYAILALFILRKVLLRYFDDITTAITLASIVLATNLIQYISVDSAMSHGYIFPLYASILLITIKWHEKPSFLWAILAGIVTGLATISRPTEAIMVLIPILWSTQNPEAAKEKWEMVKNNKPQIYAAVVAGIIGISPQLIYWKITSGSWIFDVGSKWTFLNPFFRVIVGFEKGWFIYTPITMLFIIGMFFIKKYPFRKSVLWFGLLNIYIIISWFDWRYGASYSARALSQSYPVYALPFAAFLTYANSFKWKWALYALLIYLTYVNLFQIQQYNNGVLHYDHMNRKYYGEIYLVDNPSPEQYSLLDTDEYLENQNNYLSSKIFALDSNVLLETTWNQFIEIANDSFEVTGNDNWIKVTANITVNQGFGDSYLSLLVKSNDFEKQTKVRLFRPRAYFGQPNDYSFFIKLPSKFAAMNYTVSIGNETNFQGVCNTLTIEKISL